MIWYKFNVRDYLVSTNHLADAEDLAYRRLLDLYYLTEKPIPGPASVVAQKIKLDVDCVQPVLDEFFDLEDGLYYHRASDDAIAKRQHQRVICSAAGKIGGKHPKPKGKREVSPTKTLIAEVGKITVA